MSIKKDGLNEIGKTALESIRCMVAALECDYERLDELRDNKEPAWIAICEGEQEIGFATQDEAKRYVIADMLGNASHYGSSGNQALAEEITHLAEDANLESDDFEICASNLAIGCGHRWVVRHGSGLMDEELAELAELEIAASAGDVNYPCESREDAEERIHDDALEVNVRSGWVADRSEMIADEFMILITTGGPAVRIRGELDEGTVTRAYLQVQDWGTSWTDYYEEGVGELCETYASCFFFE